MNAFPAPLYDEHPVAPSQFSRSERRPRQQAYLPPTTPLWRLPAGRLLCLMDDDNLRISLRRHDASLSYRRLLQRLSTQASALRAWAVFTHQEGENKRAKYLTGVGWQVLPVSREYLVRRGNVEVKGNADNDIAFLAGRLALEGRFDAVVLGTGDGDLAAAVARCIKSFVRTPLVTLSVPGSSSRRLLDRELFADRLFVGRDLIASEDLPPVPQPRFSGRFLGRQWIIP